MIPSVFFFNISFKKKILIILLSSVMIFLIYIFGNFFVNSNNDQKIELVDKKFYVKVISPNFELGYNFTKEEMEKD